MPHKFAEIAFTRNVRQVQEQMGSRAGYSSMDSGPDHNYVISGRERAFIEARDSFYMASVSETEWPYLQHRGGPAGFMKVLDESTIGFADYSGNRQYVTTGNVVNNDRVALFFMDYPNRTRLKLLGRMEIVGPGDTERLSQLEDDGYRARVERGMIIHVEAFDWNCPQHITPRYTESDVAALIEPLGSENGRLRAAVGKASTVSELNIGQGELELIITGIRQLADNVRAYELRDPSGADLPEVEPGAHLQVPVQVESGVIEIRRYSIASNPSRRDAYEIAIRREPEGGGGSRWIHQHYHLGAILRVSGPINHFGLHNDRKSAILIAGGIGITPIKPMAQALRDMGAAFELHYAGRSGQGMAYLYRLRREFGDRFISYISENGERLNPEGVLAAAPSDAEIYVCGPAKLIQGVREAAKRLGIDESRVNFERFDSGVEDDARSVEVTLARSGLMVSVTPDQTILDAILDAGVNIPSSCRVGQCRSCAVTVLDGEPDHKDSALTPDERRIEHRMCPCVSRAKGESLVLDV